MNRETLQGNFIHVMEYETIIELEYYGVHLGHKTFLTNRKVQG